MKEFPLKGSISSHAVLDFQIDQLISLHFDVSGFQRLDASLAYSNPCSTTKQPIEPLLPISFLHVFKSYFTNL